MPRYAQTAAPQADDEHRSVVDGEGRGEAARTSELSCGSGTGRPARPVPAPRQSLDSTLVPVPALKSKNAQAPSSSSAAGIVVAVLVLFSLIDDITELQLLEKIFLVFLFFFIAESTEHRSKSPLGSSHM